MGSLGRILLMIWAATWGLFWTGFMGGLYSLIALFHRTPGWQDFCQRFHGQVLLATLGIRMEVHGLENFDAGQATVLMPNHRSWLDIPVLAVTIPSLRFVAKKEIVRVPLFGWALPLSENILIDRSDQRAAIAELRKAAQELGPGRNLVVFPEGTRAEGETLLPFKKGGFHLALDTGLPIVPISIDGNQRTLPKHSLLLRPGKVRVTVHPPISVEEKARRDVPDLMSRVRASVLSGLPGTVDLEAGPNGTEKAGKPE